MILVRVRNDTRMNHFWPFRTRVHKTILDVTHHVVFFAGVNDHYPAFEVRLVLVRHDHQAAITLADVNKRDLKNRMGLDIAFFHPAVVDFSALIDAYPDLCKVARWLFA